MSAPMEVDVSVYIVLSAVIFFIGVAGVILRRNPLIMVMAIELMFNAANLALIAFARAWTNNAGQIFAFLVITVAAAEVAIGLAIVVVVFRRAQNVDVDLLTQSGNVSGELLNLVYLALMPFRLTQQKYVNLLQMQGDRAQLENFMRMEKWIFDSPDQPARAFREFVQWFFQENRLIRNELTLAGRQVLLENIKSPVLNIFAANDHLVPPSASIALGAHVGCDDYEALQVDVGHIGMYVSGKARKTVPEAITRWLLKRKPRSLSKHST